MIKGAHYYKCKYFFGFDPNRLAEKKKSNHFGLKSSSRRFIGFKVRKKTIFARHKSKQMKSFSFLLSFTILAISVFASDPSMENRIDSLSRLINQSQGNQKIELLNHLANVYLNTDNQKAIETANLALSLARDRKLLKEIARAAFIIAEANFFNNDYYAAIEYYKISANAEKELNGKWSADYGERLGDIGYIYNQIPIFDKTIEYSNKSLDVAKHLNDEDQIASMLNNIGSAHFYVGNYDEALNYFHQVLEIDRRRELDNFISIDLNNIGKVYFTWGKFEQAIQAYEDSYQYALKAENESMQAIRLSNLGQVYNEMDDYETALQYLNQALEIDRRLENEIRVGIRLSRIGSIYQQMGDFDRALNLFEEALQIFQLSDVQSSEIMTLIQIGELQMERGNIFKAIEHFNQALNPAYELELRPQIMQIYQNLSEAFKLSDDYQSALDYFQNYTEIKDSLFNEERHKQIAEYAALFEMEKKEKENELLRQEAVLMMQKTELQQKQKLIYFISAIGLLVLLLWLFFLFNSKRKLLLKNKALHEQEVKMHQLEMVSKEKENRHLQEVLFAEEQINSLQKSKIQQKSQELTASTMHILNKNQVLGKIRKLSAEALNENSFHKERFLNQLIETVDENTDLDEQWNQFKVHFESVHHGFFSRMLNKHPNLTQNELKLCAYLRINLSSKEIAQMLNISPESLITKRYRLRKKLDLDTEDNLVKFLSNF